MAIGSQFEVETVRRTIARNLPLLRGLYRDSRSSFSDEDLSFLQQARSILATLDTYSELAENFLEEFDDADAEGLLHQLVALQSQLGQIPCAEEFDGLFAQIKQRSGIAITRRAIKEQTQKLLLSQTPGCLRCGQQMVLRESKYGQFWGCARFPECEGKREVQAERPRA